MKTTHYAISSVAIIMLFLSLMSCGGSGGGGAANGDGSNNIATGQAKITGTVQADPADSTASGEEAGSTVYVIGQQDKATTTDANGNFELTVDATLTGTILSSPKGFFASLFKTAGDVKQFGLVVLSQGNTYGKHGRKTEVQVTEGQANALDTIYINKVGTISGKALLQGETDHTGITVYVPGTSFIAMTAADGSYTISDVPAGTYDVVRADKLGETYHYAVTAKVTVNSGADTQLSDMLLQLTTDPNGAVLINNGDAYTTSTTVKISIAPSPNAVMMQISEDVNFTGLSWVPVQGTQQYIFSGNFINGGTATIYAKFADASGLTSSPVSDTIHIDTSPLASIIAPVAVTDDTKPKLQWSYTAPIPNATYHVQVATDSAFTSIVSGQDQTGLTQQQYTVTTALSNLTTYYWRVAIIDQAGKQWNWSGPWSFQIDLSSATLVSPLNSAPTATTFINYSSNNTGITFTWQQNARAVSYTLQVSSNTDLGGATTYSTTQTNYKIPSISTADGPYYWAVTPVDTNGVSGTRSDIWKFVLDTTRPGVLVTSPSSTDQNASKKNPLTAIFSEPIVASTIDSPAITFTVNNSVNGTVAYNPSTLTATFSPYSFLKFGTTYTATITTAVTDIAGNAMAASKIWSFKTTDLAEGWIFVDGNTDAGINKDPNNVTAIAGAPVLAPYNAKLYAAWHEDNGTAYQIRASVYSNSSWSFLDGGSTTGINYASSSHAVNPSVTTANGSLYVAWDEVYSGASTTHEIRVKSYNGSSWSSADGNGAFGINKNPAHNAYYPFILGNGTSLYAAWVEDNGTAQQTRVSLYNGTTWSIIDGNGANGLNRNPLKGSAYPRLAALGTDLYAAWHENSGSGGTSQIRVALYSGGTWTFVDGGDVNDGINKNKAYSAFSVRLATYNNRLYAAWYEDSSGSVGQIRVARYDGPGSWTFIDGNGATGINKVTTKGAGYPHMTVINSKLYVTWMELNGTYQIRVAAYDESSNTWQFVDGNGSNGLNKNITKNAYYPYVVFDGNNPYITWSEPSQTYSDKYQVRVISGQ